MILPLSLRRIAVCIALQLMSLPGLRAEVRAFTNTLGQTLRGELVSITGDMVTIKREADGQTFTVKASGFSPADIAYFREHGLKAAAAAETPVPADSNPLRLQVTITPKKVERNRGGGNYGTTQRTTFKVEIRNNERSRELSKAHGILLCEAKEMSTAEESQLIGKEEFDINVPALGTFTYETKEPARSYFYGYDHNFGTRYAGHVLIILDSTGKTISVNASSDTIAKHAENLRKLNLWDIFDKSNYKRTKEGYAPMY